MNIIERFKSHMLEKYINKILDILPNADYAQLKHTILQLKWQALRNNDNDTYEEASAYYDCIDRLEKFYCK